MKVNVQEKDEYGDTAYLWVSYKRGSRKLRDVLRDFNPVSPANSEGYHGQRFFRQPYVRRNRFRVLITQYTDVDI